MSSSKKLSGFHPSRVRGAGANSTGFNEYPIANARSGAIFQGDLVKVTAGTICPVAATTDYAVGVFMGCRYVDPTSKQPTWSKYYPSGVSSSDGNVYAFVDDDSRSTFIIQSDASVTAMAMNSFNYSVTLGTGSTNTGISGQGLKSSTATSATAQLRPIRYWAAPDNESDADRAFPELEVRIVQHIDNRAIVCVA
tara:strand:+ start:1556 stop:2140 length:585 start_codon:yes stop_codon:yes gene_type:complete